MSEPDAEDIPEFQRSLEQVSTAFPTEAEEVRQRMAQHGTNDPVEVLVEAVTPRLIGLAEKSPEERAVIRNQARSWRERRAALGLSLEELAEQIGLSAFELGLLEHGFPSPEGIAPEISHRLDDLLSP